MILQIGEWESEFSGSAEQIFEKINELVEERNLLLNNLIIDGVEIYDDFVTSIQSMSEEGKKIEIIAFSLEEVEGMMKKEAIKKLEGLRVDVEKLSNLFYSSGKGSIESLVEVLERTYEIKRLASDIEVLQGEKGNLLTLLLELNSTLISFQTAVEKEDSVHIADLLHHELLKNLHDILVEIQ